MVKKEKKSSKKLPEKIFDLIKKSKKVLLCLHVSPDLDCLSSVLAMARVLRRMRKEVRIISFSQIPPLISFLPGAEEIEIADFAKIDLSGFSLMVALDTAQERMITRSRFPKKLPKDFKIVNIDHHFSNTFFGDINLIMEVSSTAELLYRLFKYWRIKVDKELAEILLYGIVSDTGCFRYSLTSSETFKIASEILEKGVDFEKIVLNTFKSYNFKTLKYWGKILENMEIDEEAGFVWSKISKKECEELGVLPTDIEGAADFFCGVVRGTRFGIILNEEAEGCVRVSLRTREDFNVAKLAEKFGGGGHKAAAGLFLELPFEEAEKRIVEEARKMARESSD